MNSAMNLPNYYLREQVFACLADRHYILLDLLADKYLRVDKRPFEALSPRASISSPLSMNANEPRGQEPTDESRILLRKLLERGLLTENPAKAHAGALESVARPAETLMNDIRIASLTLSLSYMPTFIVAGRLASHSLKRPISQTVNYVAERKRRQAHRTAQFSLERARALISIFCRLRPFYARQYLCLFDSLALLNFLAPYGIFPTWIFGVQSEPFAAHCWVQHDEFLLNDTVDHVSVYTPLLAV